MLFLEACKLFFGPYGRYVHCCALLPSLICIIFISAATQNNIVYIEQKYGGHLGFYEGGFMVPNALSWLDRTMVNLADALCAYDHSGKDKLSPPVSSGDDDSGEEATTSPGPRASSKRPTYVCRRRHRAANRTAAVATKLLSNKI